MVANTSDYSPAEPIVPRVTARTKREAASRLDAVHDTELVARFLAGDEGAFA